MDLLRIHRIRIHNTGRDGTKKVWDPNPRPIPYPSYIMSTVWQLRLEERLEVLFFNISLLDSEYRLGAETDFL